MSLDLNELIIDAVRSRREIWDPKAPGHRNNERIKVIWEEIAQHLGLPAELLRTRWKTLRDRFVKENKKIFVKVTGSGGQKIVNKWPLFDQMLFIKQTVEPRQTVSNFDGLTLGQLAGLEDEEIANEITILSNGQDHEEERIDDPQPLPTIQRLSSMMTPPSRSNEANSPFPSSSSNESVKRKKTLDDSLEKQLMKRLNTSPRKYNAEEHFYISIAKDAVKLSTRGRMAVRQAALAALSQELARESTE